MRQKGAARLRALELELAYVPEAEVPDETTGDVAKVPAKYDFGIQRRMAACEEMVGRSATDRKGELRERYCLTLKRGNSESVTNFALRYRTLVAESSPGSTGRSCCSPRCKSRCLRRCWELLLRTTWKARRNPSGSSSGSTTWEALLDLVGAQATLDGALHL